MTNRLWPTDRVRICVKEHCRMHNLPYSSVSREEGLAVLASIADCSISEMETLNPIHFVRLFLNDTRDDPIELIIKLCHLFGPYTYKGLAALYSQEYRLPPILEVSEEQKDVSDCGVTDDGDCGVIEVSDCGVTDVSDCGVIEVSDCGVTDVSDCGVIEVSGFDTEVTDVSNSEVDIVAQDPIQKPQDPFVVPKSKSGCFFFRC
jgi:hypothetical protein